MSGGSRLGGCWGGGEALLLACPAVGVAGGECRVGRWSGGYVVVLAVVGAVRRVTG